MFGKSSKKLETIIGNESDFNGDLTVKGTVRIDGRLEGNIQADWVIIGEAGEVKGNVKSRGTVVGGRFAGQIDADEIVELKQRAQVTAEIRTEKLVVSEGAVFEGQTHMKSGKEEAGDHEGRVIALNPPSAAP